MATYLAMGLRFNKSVYKEICQILRDFDTIAAIIPVYEEENMEYLITQFFQLNEELGHDTIRCRIIFRMFTWSLLTQATLIGEEKNQKFV
jgi:hypothetical protein